MRMVDKGWDGMVHVFFPLFRSGERRWGGEGMGIVIIPSAVFFHACSKRGVCLLGWVILSALLSSISFTVSYIPLLPFLSRRATLMSILM
jgi:hypothetical protein